MATEECEELGMDSLVRDCDEVIVIIFDSKFDDKHPLEVFDTAILTLYSSLIDKYKTVNILQDQRVTTEVNLIERSFIEQYVYLLFILDKHTKERGRAYLINQRYESYRQTKRLLDNLSDEKQVRELKASIDGIIKADRTDRQTFADGLSYFSGKFENLFKPALLRNEQKRRKGLSVPPDKKIKRIWYNVAADGTNNFRDLCRKLGLDDLYFGFYGPLSMNVHGVDSPANLVFDNITDPGRNVAEVVLQAGHDEQGTVSLLRAFLIEITLKVCHHYAISRNKIPNQMYLKQKI